MSERGSIHTPEVGGEQSDFTDSPGVATETFLAVLGPPQCFPKSGKEAEP